MTHTASMTSTTVSGGFFGGSRPSTAATMGPTPNTPALNRLASPASRHVATTIATTANAWPYAAVARPPTTTRAAHMPTACRGVQYGTKATLSSPITAGRIALPPRISTAVTNGTSTTTVIFTAVTKDFLGGGNALIGFTVALATHGALAR